MADGSHSFNFPLPQRSKLRAGEIVVDLFAGGGGASEALKPAELFRAQGFPSDYIIDRTADGRTITNTHAVRMVGNSVSPPPLCALARANLDAADVPLRIAA